MKLPLVGGVGDHPFVTTAIASLFVLGLLYKNWILEIRDWIEAKVSDQPSVAGGSNAGGVPPAQPAAPMQIGPIV